MSSKLISYDILWMVSGLILYNIISDTNTNIILGRVVTSDMAIRGKIGDQDGYLIIHIEIKGDDIEVEIENFDCPVHNEVFSYSSDFWKLKKFLQDLEI